MLDDLPPTPPGQPGSVGKTPAVPPTQGSPQHGYRDTGLPRPDEPRWTSITGKKGDVDRSEPDFFKKAGAGYVETPGGPVCGNCEYARGNLCVLFDFLMDPVNGCCSYWEAADQVKDTSKDWIVEAKEDADDGEVETVGGDDPARPDNDTDPR